MTEPNIKPLVISGTGTATTLELIDWFNDCEKAFQQWEFYQNRVLPDGQKIFALGKAIKDEGATKHIYDWYISLSIPASQTFQQFQAELFETALGERWAMEILKEFHTNSQGSRTSDQYIHSSQKLAYAVNTIGFPVPKLSPMEQKAHLLFNADPGIVAAILKNDLSNQNKFVQASKQKIERLLADYESSKTGPTAVTSPTVVTNPAGSSTSNTDVIYMMTGMARLPTAKYLYYSDTAFLPPDRAPRVLRVMANAYPQSSVGFYSFVYDDNTVASSISYSVAPTIQSLDFTLRPTEHLKTLKVEYGSGAIGVKAICFVTSEGREQNFRGSTNTDWTHTYHAPDGWGIVGLHSYSYIQQFTRSYMTIGCIFGRV